MSGELYPKMEFNSQPPPPPAIRHGVVLTKFDANR